MYVGGWGKGDPPEKGASPALMGWPGWPLPNGAILQRCAFPWTAVLVGEVTLFFLLPVKRGDLWTCTGELFSSLTAEGDHLTSFINSWWWSDMQELLDHSVQQPCPPSFLQPLLCHIVHRLLKCLAVPKSRLCSNICFDHRKWQIIPHGYMNGMILPEFTLCSYFFN